MEKLKENRVEQYIIELRKVEKEKNLSPEEKNKWDDERK
jgi:lipase chaperone LimK